MDPIRSARPDITPLIHPKPIGKAGQHLVELLTAGYPPVLMHVETPDVLTRLPIELTATLSDVEHALVGRECKPVRPLEVIRSDGEIACSDVETIERRRQLGSLLTAFVIRADPIERVAEPDRPIGLAHDVVRRVEALAAIMAGEHRHRAVELRAGDAAIVM